MHFSNSDAVELLKECLNKFHPSKIIPGKLSFKKDTSEITIAGSAYSIKESGGIYLNGSGKASVAMAKAVMTALGDIVISGMVIAKEYDQSISDSIEILTSSHPIPDRSSLEATEKLINFAESIPPGSIVLNLISGGTSSLFCKPANGISIEDYADMVSCLLKSGASIDEINLVRKSVSAVKAGRFLDSLRHTRLIDLIISDVPDDNPKNIGSGPTTAQSFRYRDVTTVLDKYDLHSTLPKSILNFISTNSERTFRSKDLNNHQSHIILSAGVAADMTAKTIQYFGFHVIKDNNVWSGPSDKLQQHIMECAEPYLKSNKSTALIFYGESTVKVTGDGKGGRNQELALRMAESLSRYERDIIFLSAGTDGIDGPTDAAGAVLDQKTKSRAEKQGIELQDYLKRNDSYHFFEQTGGLIKTGATGNNVMDLQLLFIP